jgi:glutathione S-transferase
MLIWMSHWMSSGFEAIERQLGERSSGRAGCLAERPGLFECFLVPQVYNADRYAVDMSPYPEICAIVKHCRKLPEFLQATPENQADATPG